MVSRRGRPKDPREQSPTDGHATRAPAGQVSETRSASARLWKVLDSKPSGTGHGCVGLGCNANRRTANHVDTRTRDDPGAGRGLADGRLTPTRAAHCDGSGRRPPWGNDGRLSV